MQPSTARLLQIDMKWLKRIDAWRSRRFQFTLDRWDQVRVKGRGPFVLRQGLTWMVMMTAGHDVLAHIICSADKVPGIWGYLGQYFVTGIFLGYGEWSSNEDKYRDARLNASTPVFSLPTGIKRR